jgi:hypothetical protein
MEGLRKDGYHNRDHLHLMAHRGCRNIRRTTANLESTNDYMWSVSMSGMETW